MMFGWEMGFELLGGLERTFEYFKNNMTSRVHERTENEMHFMLLLERGFYASVRVD